MRGPDFVPKYIWLSSKDLLKFLAVSLLEQFLLGIGLNVS